MALKVVEQLRRQHTMADVGAESPVALPLRFIEELIVGGFLRKRRMRAMIVAHVLRFVAGEGGFHVHEPGACPALAVRDRRQSRMRL